jgi:GAF domain-containing protein
MEAQLLRAVQLENTQLKEEVGRLRDYMHGLQSLTHVAQLLLSEKDLMTLLDRTLYYAVTVLDARDGALLLADEEKNDLVFVLVQGQVREKLPGYRIPSNEGVAGWVYSHLEPLIVNNARADPRFLPIVDQVFNFQTRSLVCVPLIAPPKGGQPGKVLGVIEVVNKSNGQDFSEADQDLLSILALVAAISLDSLAHEPEEKKKVGKKRPSPRKKSTPKKLHRMKKKTD